MKDFSRFKFVTEITVTKEDVVEKLKDDGFFDIDEYDEIGDYIGTTYDEEAIKNYEPTYDDFESVAQEMFENDNCEYFGPDPI